MDGVNPFEVPSKQQTRLVASARLERDHVRSDPYVMKCRRKDKIRRDERCNLSSSPFSYILSSFFSIQNGLQSCW